MQAPASTAAAAERPPDRYVVRPAGVLAEILGAAEMGEDELLLRLREAGLITYPSPLLAPLLEEWPDVLAAEVLARLDPTDLVVFGQAGRACRAAVVAFGVPQEEAGSGYYDDDVDASTRAGTAEGEPLRLRVKDFVGSVERLAWAHATECPWEELVCSYAAEVGHLEVLKWARQQDCPWDSMTCSDAAYNGHLEVLKWAREQGCEWDDETGHNAAEGGHLEVMKWAHENGCQWSEVTCLQAARKGHWHVLQYLREHHCPWDSKTCSYAAESGQLGTIMWARARGCPWDEQTTAAPRWVGT